MAGPQKKRLGNNPLSPYRALIRGGRSDVVVEEESDPDAGPGDLSPGLPSAGPSALPVVPPAPAATAASTEAAAPVESRPGPPVAVPAPSTAPTTTTAATVPLAAEPPAVASAAQMARGDHAPAPAPSPPAARQIRAPKSWSPQRGATGRRSGEAVERSPEEPSRQEPAVSSRYRSGGLAAAVARRRDERGAHRESIQRSDAAVRSEAERRLHGEHRAQDAPGRHASLPGQGTLDTAALELLERLLKERAAEPTEEPSMRRRAAGRLRTGERTSAELLERAAADRLQRRRQKTIYLSDEACERLREVSFWMRVDQSTIVEEALAEFFEKHEPRRR